MKSSTKSVIILFILISSIFISSEKSFSDIIWSLDGTLPVSVSHHGAAVVDNAVFYFGGFSPWKYQSDLSYLYSPGGTTIPMADMPDDGRHDMAYLEHHGRVYSIAGYNEKYAPSGSGGKWGRTIHVWSYDPASNLWGSETSLTYERSNAGSASLGDYIYIVGGHHEDTGHGFTLSLVERYNPDVGGSWTSVASLNQDRSGLGVASVGGKIYAIGGQEYEIGVKNEIGGWMEIYDPSTNIWTWGQPMPTARDYFAVTVVRNRIYTIGGRTSDGSLTDAVEYYDVVEGAWHSDTPLPVAALGLKAVAINNKIYVLGGKSSSDGLETVYAGSLDQTPPELTISVSPDQLWPPNHKMVDIVVSIVTSDEYYSDPSVILESVVSSEPDDAPGGGDGNTNGDIQGADFGTDDREFQLRAERDAKGSSRIYTITYKAIDVSGNEAVAVTSVSVPHDQGDLKKHSILADESSSSESYARFQNHPNPFNPETSISYTIPEASHVTLEIYNISGERIATLINEQSDSGYHSVNWDSKDDLGRSVAGGIYFCKIQVGSYHKTIRMLLLK